MRNTLAPDLGAGFKSLKVDERRSRVHRSSPFQPAETAERLGVSIKALRVYERQGMVTPMRTAAGWRAGGLAGPIIRRLRHARQ